MIIDAHAHLGRFNSWPLAKGGTDEVAAMLRSEGISHALVSSALSLYYDCPAGNAEVLAAAAHHPELLPLLCVNPRRPQEAMAELSTCERRGFLGVKLHPTAHEYSLTSAEADAVLDYCEQRGIAVLTHSGEDDPRCDPRAIEGAAVRHPDLPLVVGHACLFSSREVVAVAEAHPNLYLEISVNYEAGKLEDTIGRLGCGRLLFGSDAPLHHPGVMLQRVRAIGLVPAEEALILAENARRLFRLAV
jgi:uncharacterized protein